MVTAERHNIDRLWQVYTQTRSPVLRNHLVEHYTGNVKRIAQRISDRLPESVELDDLIGAGVVGLIEAIGAFEPERGLKFNTFSAFRIRGAIIDYLREIDWVPRLSRERTRKMTAAIAALESAEGCSPSRDQIRRKMGVTKLEFDRIEADQARPMLSMDDPFGFDEHGVPECVGNYIADFRELSAEERADCNALLAAVARDFSVTDALLLRFRHLDGLPFIRIGKMFGFSESNASIRYARLIEWLRGRYAKDAARLEGRAA